MKSQETTNRIIESLLQTKFVQPKCYLQSKLKLNDVAEMIGTNRTYLSHYFNHCKNTTFYAYINTLRLEYALKLMSAGDFSLKQIAAKSGFTSYSSFHRAFITKFGYAPSSSQDK